MKTSWIFCTRRVVEELPRYDWCLECDLREWGLGGWISVYPRAVKIEVQLGPLEFFMSWRRGERWSTRTT